MVHRFLLEHAHSGPDDTVSVGWKKEREAAFEKLGPGVLSHAIKDFTQVTPQP